MTEYKSSEFVEALLGKMGKRDAPPCPFCGGREYTAIDKYVTILIGSDLEAINIGPSIPSGVLVCETCGHIDLFALGSLGMLNKKETEEDGE